MEPTLTQNCALYYAQHKTSKRRATLFKKFRAAAREVAHAINPIVRRYPLSVKDTTKAPIACGVRAAYVAQIASALK